MSSAKSSSGLTILSLSLPVLLSSLGTSIANIALPALAEAFSASFQAVQWVVLAYLLAITTLIVGVGRLGDLIGRRRLMLSGLGLFTLASALAGLSPTLWLLITARALQGLGAAIMMTIGMALTAETVSPAKTGSVMGLLGTMSAMGTSLGPSLGGSLITLFGWQAIFLAQVPLGLVSFGLVWRAIPAAPSETDRERPDFDLTGTVWLALTLAAYALAMTLGRGHFSLLNALLLGAAVIGVGVFVWVEARTRTPLIRLAIFRDRAMSSGLAANVLVSTVMMATLVVGPFYLSRALGLNAAYVGLLMSVGPIISALSGVPAGRLVDRLGTSSAAVWGLIIMTAGSLALCGLGLMSHLAIYIAAITLLTPGYQLFQAANNTAVMANVGPDQRGVISGALNLSRNIGLISGASVMGAIFALASGTGDMTTRAPEAVTRGLWVTFAVAALMIGLAVGLVVRADRSAHNRPASATGRTRH